MSEATHSRLVRFPSTHWSVIALAAGAGGAGPEADAAKRRALEELLRRYLKPMRAYLVRTRGLSAESADDLLQEFVVAKVLEEELIALADRRRGKFRTFLLTALNRFLVDRVRHEGRSKRGGGGAVVSLEEVIDLVDVASDPQAVFALEWARGVIDEAVRRTRGECDAVGRPELWGVFEARLLAPAMDGAEPVPYRELARRMGLESEGQGPNLLAAVKRIFRRALRDIVGEYARDEQEVEAEIAELEALLAGASGRRPAG